MSETESHESRVREHLANERTLLAWVRTAIALYGLGFVITQFALFLRQVGGDRAGAVASPDRVPAFIAAALVLAGIVSMALGAIRFFRARAQIERGSFEPEYFAEAVLVALGVIGGAALLVYLVAKG